jgi:hypothetical protein
LDNFSSDILKSIDRIYIYDYQKQFCWQASD